MKIIWAMTDQSLTKDLVITGLQTRPWIAMFYSRKAEMVPPMNEESVPPGPCV